MHHIPSSLLERRPGRGSQSSPAWALLTALAVVIVTWWWALPTRAAAPDTFDLADTNHDGRLTLEEFEAFITQRLTQRQGPGARAFRRLSPEAQRARLKMRFQQLDRGHKGYLDRGDWSVAASMLRADRDARAGTPAQGLVLGAGLAATDPGYIGYHLRVDPFPFFSYRHGPFYLDGPSVGIVAVQSETYALSGVLTPDFRRLRASDSPELAGISTREWSLDGGVKFALRETWGTASVEALQDVLGRSNGTTLSLDYGYPIALGTGVRLTPRVGLEWESADLTSYYYGVSRAESLPDRPVYSAGAALNPSIRVDLALPLSLHWHLGAGLGYTRFGRSIRDSPLVDRPGSLGLAISLVWWDSSPGAE